MEESENCSSDPHGLFFSFLSDVYRLTSEAHASMITISI